MWSWELNTPVPEGNTQTPANALWVSAEYLKEIINYLVLETNWLIKQNRMLIYTKGNVLFSFFWKGNMLKNCPHYICVTNNMHFYWSGRYTLLVPLSYAKTTKNVHFYWMNLCMLYNNLVIILYTLEIANWENEICWIKHNYIVKLDQTLTKLINR